MKEENIKREEEIKILKETNRIILIEIEQLKKNQKINMIEDYKNNLTFKGNNLIEGEFIECYFEYKNNEIQINNRNKKLGIEGVNY